MTSEDQSKLMKVKKQLLKPSKWTLAIKQFGFICCSESQCQSGFLTLVDVGASDASLCCTPSMSFDFIRK